MTPENMSVTPNNWIVLDIEFCDECVVKFVLNNGSTLDEFLPDYDASLTINYEVKEITIKNNSFSDTLVNASYEVCSLNTGELLAKNKLYYDDSFSALNDLIRNNTTIELTHNYTFYFGVDKEFVNGIKIRDNVVIDGNGFTIDGFNLTRVFNVIGNNVTIKNLNSVNIN